MKLGPQSIRGNTNTIKPSTLCSLYKISRSVGKLEYQMVVKVNLNKY